MPSNAGVALGAMSEVFGKAFAQKKQQQHDDEQERIKLISGLVTAGLQSGNIANPQDAFNFLLETIGSKGKGKGGKTGADSPGHQMLRTIVGATHQAGGGTTVGGQEKPSFAQPGAANAPRFLSPQERTALDTEALRSAEGVKAETAGKTLTSQLGAREMFAKRLVSEGVSQDEAYERAGLKAHVPKITPEKDLEPDPTSTTGFVRVYRDEAGQVVRREPAVPPASFVVKQGTATQYFETKAKELGHPLSTKELADAAREWSQAHGTLTPEQKLSLGESLAQYRANLNLPEPGTVTGEAQTIRLGGEDVQFVNLDSFTGEKSKNSARKTALDAGIIPVTKQQADQLAAANTALGNLNEFFRTLQDKMPPDAASRPLAQVEIPIKQFFQTDEDLAAAVAWNITILPQLRAMNVTGRVPVFEYQQALNSQPKLTDTVGTAAKKLAIVRGTLERGARSIVTRGKANAAASSATIPPEVATALKDKANGRKYRVGGVIYNKLADGTIEVAK